MKIIKRFLISLLMLVITVNSIPNIKAQEEMYTISKTATNLDENFNSNISLSLSKNLDDKDKVVDIELIIDITTLASENFNRMISHVYELIDTLKGIDEVETYVGIIGFSGASKEFLPLTNIDSISSASTLSNTFYSFANLMWMMNNRTGSNLHGALINAKNILDNSTTGSAPYERYIIMLTDGGNYTYNNKDGVTSTTIYQTGDHTYNNIGNGDSAGGDYGSADRETKLVQYYNETNDYVKAFNKLMEEYDDIKTHADRGYRWNNTNATSIEAAAEAGDLTIYSGEDISDLSIYPYTNLETGTVMAASVLKEMAENKYNIFNIGYLYSYGFNDEGEMVQRLYGLPSYSFIQWTETVGKLYMHHTKSDISIEDFEEVFADIKNEVINNIHKKPYVVDLIGSGTYSDSAPYNFDFINDIEKFDLVENDITLDKHLISENKYGFGLVDGEYKYILTYTPGDNENIKIDINYDMPKDTNVVFNYNIELSDDTIKDLGGIYGEFDATGINELDTLKSSNGATLYTPSGDNLDYGVPTLSYEIIRYNASVIKHDNSTITLSKENELKEDEEVTINMTCDDGYEFTSLEVFDKDSNKITYNDSYKFNMPASDVTVSGVCSLITYKAEVVKHDNSTITLSKENELKEDEEVTINMTCDDGYEFTYLDVLDKEENSINYTKSGDNYVFNMPASDVTVSGVCKKVEVPVEPKEEDEPEEKQEEKKEEQKETTPEEPANGDTKEEDKPIESDEKTPITNDNIVFNIIVLIISIINLFGIYMYKKMIY